MTRRRTRRGTPSPSLPEPDACTRPCARERKRRGKKKQPRGAAVSSGRDVSAVTAIDGILVQGILHIAVLLLDLAFCLIRQTFGLLLAATDNLASFFLDLTADIFGLA